MTESKPLNPSYPPEWCGLRLDEMRAAVAALSPADRQQLIKLSTGYIEELARVLGEAEKQAGYPADWPERRVRRIRKALGFTHP